MSQLNIEEIFTTLEQASKKGGLLPREANILRLLGEEMFSMTMNLTDQADCSFYVSNKEKKYELRLTAKTLVSPESKRDFVSVSSKGENTLAKGLFGKMRSAMEDLLYSGENEGHLTFYTDPTYGYAQVWTLNDYIQDTPYEKQKEDWDGLERSILLNTADDIIIGVNGKMVEMTVKKAFA